ncbi:metallophosphoesterase family protein [Egbenema bharatensis]|uniref:metallophosphoesterase family protein n=1 Tax=Egbenema bharatensis TaxID=3463334 RepID=UPI003A876B12
MNTLLNLQSLGNDYSFAIIADPQLTNQKDYYGNWGKHPSVNYRMYYQTIQKINALRPAFVVINGDFVNQYSIPSQYRNFVRMTKLIQVPVVLNYGNHDGAPPFTQFFNAQQEISGSQAFYQSFNAGKWHYIVLPAIPHEYDPEPMLNWLANDLQANQTRPTVVFSHYHYLPQGLTQLEYYAQNPLKLRNRILDQVLQYGNVKYWYTGHVHNGIQTSVKTAWEYRGCKFITVPTTTLARNFGEEYPLFKQGLKKGGYFMMVEVNDETATLTGRRAEQPNIFFYPDRFPTFQPQLEPRWLEPVPTFSPRLFSNGSFETGLQGWYKVWRYQADRQPGFITRSNPSRSTAGKRSLELAVREKGQNWSQDELTEVYQMVGVPANTFPVLQLNYQVDQLSEMGGGYIRLHAYQGTAHQFTMIFYVGHDGKNIPALHIGRIFHLTATGEVGGLNRLVTQKQVMFWKLNQQDKKWHDLKVDIRKLYQDASQVLGLPKPFQVDKLFLGLGAWNGSIPDSKTRLFFDRVRLHWRTVASSSRNDGDRLPINQRIYRGRFVLGSPGGNRRSSASGLHPNPAKQQSLPLAATQTALSAGARSVKRELPVLNPSNPDPLTGMSQVESLVSNDSNLSSPIEHSIPLAVDDFTFHNPFASNIPLTGLEPKNNSLETDDFRLGFSSITQSSDLFQRGTTGTLSHQIVIAPSPTNLGWQPDLC